MSTELYPLPPPDPDDDAPSGATALYTFGSIVLALVLTVLALSCAPERAGAQTFRAPQTSTPPACTTCPAGPQGPPGPAGPTGPAGRNGRDGEDGTDGRDGADGRDGRDGVDAAVCPVVVYRPFDLGAHGLTLPVSAIVRDGCRVFVLAYSPAVPAAVLVDPLTGLAQVALNFSAGVGVNERGALTFDKVEVLDRDVFLWWHRGGAWSHRWPAGLPWWDLKTILIDNPRRDAQGRPLPPEALFRWRP